MSAILDTAKLILGQPGSGKTVTAKDEVAQLLEQRRHVAIVDPTGVWWGMRSNAAGDGPGFTLPIFGGMHGDVEIRPDQGAAIARIILGTDTGKPTSAIVDLEAIDNSRDWRRFVHDFIAELRRGVRGNFHLVVDEADEFAQQQPADEIAFQLRENMVWMAKRGRVRGFVPTYITQRTAEIANAVISPAQTIIAHQLMLPADQKAIDNYLKGHASAETRKAVMSSLAELEIGERWVYSPRLKVLDRGFTPALTTFDSSRTPAPGEILVPPRTFAQLDVSAIRRALAAPAATDQGSKTRKPESQNSGSDNDREFARVIAELDPEAIVRRDHRIADLEAANALLTATAEELGKEKAHAVRRLSTLGAAIDAAINDLQAARRRLDRDLNMHSSNANMHPADAESAESAPSPAAPARPRGDDAPERPAPQGGIGVPPLGATAHDGEERSEGSREYRALSVLAAIAPAGMTEAAWAARAGYARKGGAWLRRRKRHSDAGLIELRDGRWYATAAGIEAAGAEIPDMPAPGPGLVKWWSDRASSRAASRALQLLGAVHPRALTRDAIAAELGMAPKGGAFLRALTELKAADLVVETKKRLSAAPELMGES